MGVVGLSCSSYAAETAQRGHPHYYCSAVASPCPPSHSVAVFMSVLQRVKEMTAKGLDYKKEMAKLKAARAAAKAKAAAAGAK